MFWAFKAYQMKLIYCLEATWMNLHIISHLIAYVDATWKPHRMESNQESNCLGAKNQLEH